MYTIFAIIWTHIRGKHFLSNFTRNVLFFSLEFLPLRANQGFLGFIIAESAIHGHVSGRGVFRVKLMAVIQLSFFFFLLLWRQQTQRWDAMVTRGQVACSCFTPYVESCMKRKWKQKYNNIEQNGLNELSVRWKLDSLNYYWKDINVAAVCGSPAILVSEASWSASHSVDELLMTD